jgi:aspartyl-tRNA(Asn)/glutamyl-tRNA(Gln) amidotransferase subunit A
MNAAELAYLDIAEASRLIGAKKLSPVELTGAVLDRIDALDGRVKSYVTVLGESARKDAAAAEKRAAAGKRRGPLDGVPVAIKDLYNTAGVRTTSCSKLRQDYVPDADSTVVAKLRAAGAVILGKLTTHEFAFGFDSPPTRNPWNLDYQTSGSSGGSGAALAAGLCLGATGSDTGGSIRAPAAANGICGIKPSYGRVSKSGVSVLSWTLDHTGPMARSARDLALLLHAIAGADPLDSTTIDVPVADYPAALSGNIRGLRIGVPKNYFFDDVDPPVEAAVRAAIAELRDLGAELVEVTVPDLDHLLEVFFSIVVPEAASFHMESFAEKPHLYQPDVRDLLEQGQLALATTYIHAQRSRAVIRDGIRRAFESIDVLVTPGLPVTAAQAGQTTYRIGDQDEPLFRAHARFNCPFNLSGLPGATIPCGFAPNGMPIGIQIVGKPFDEATTLRVADAFQRVTDWHKRRPPL